MDYSEKLYSLYMDYRVINLTLMVVPQETHGQSPTAAAPRTCQGASAASPWPGAPGACAAC